MGKFGKKVSISLNPLDYNITILGESGIGKTTLAKETCEKLVGEDGYLHLDIGNEDGAAAIEGIISEKIESYSKLIEVVDDIVENKESDYPELKVTIWDTLDELILLAEAEVIRLHNRKHPDKKIDTINSADGGFGKGQAHATELIINQMAKLRSVGVSNIIIGHVKRSEITDPLTQETYSKLTADTTQRYFNAIKNKQHFVALAYIDREIVKEKTGRKNIATKEEITVNKAVAESRVLSFRDDTYSVDSKSRFANIVDRVPFGVDEFIGAMTDAIANEKTKNGKSMADAEKEQKKRDLKKKEDAIANSKAAKELNVEKNDDYIELIKEGMAKLTTDQLAEFKALMEEVEITNFKNPEKIPTPSLKKLVKYFG